ncbi:Superfamily II DNA or RNA helicase [Geodermatophilus africanus]|uniref:Superfamily II DNA or RNA helicase n=1 Tax=Geodermatophilus africanus TaxID=1137993 RepID=A0A1H3LD84_9ACTN|nr:DEAD/DEAH box helicase family protein [Geodermatophilus africanus]SDY62351.1 Superfamily II DNA or RNA helicase [Geodermatophilus africanus]
MTAGDVRRFTGRQRAALYLAGGGACTRCGAALTPGWHGDHQLAFTAGGATDVVNGLALCPGCNTALGAHDVTGAAITGLRDWQRTALAEYETTHPVDFLAVATPGAGKTRFAATVVHRLLAAGEISRVIVVVPTQRLKTQWADAVAGYGIALEPEWANSEGALPPGFHGVVVTYAQVAALPDLFRRHTSAAPAMVVLDEIHHCGEERNWGDAIRHAFIPARRRLALSGTPFRTDNNQIPFVSYVDGVGTPDHTYDYGQAVTDGVCRPVFFPRRGGRMEWATTGGQIIRATFDDVVDQKLRNQRLNTALSLTGDWIASVLDDAHTELTELRATDPTAGGLVLAKDVEHARGIADLLRRRHGVAPVLAVSDEPGSNAAIEHFAAGDAPWIVSVRMVSEGVDVPRLRIAVFATNTITELFFRQAVGRVVRVRDGGEDETASFYIPDDARLRQFAETIRQQREHVIGADPIDAVEPPAALGSRDGAPSAGAFQPIAAEAIDAGVIAHGTVVTPVELAHAAALKARTPETAALPTVAVALLLRAHDAGRPSATAPATGQPSVPAQEPAFRRRARLRQANNTAARRLAYRLGMEFAEVNRRLNAAIGVRGIKDASLEQLERRLSAAQAWGEAGSADDVPGAR